MGQLNVDWDSVVYMLAGGYHFSSDCSFPAYKSHTNTGIHTDLCMETYVAYMPTVYLSKQLPLTLIAGMEKGVAD